MVNCTASRLRSLTVSALVLALALAGCAGTGGAASRSATPTMLAQGGATPTIAAPTQPALTPTESNALQGCKVAAGDATIGALVIGPPIILYGFNADFALPDDLPTAPLTVIVQNNESTVQGVVTLSRPVAAQGSFLADICDSSASQSYRVTALAVKLVSRVVRTGILNTLNGCAFLYSRTQGVGGECASGFLPDLERTFAFPAAATVGSVVTLPLSPAIVVAPGKDVSVVFDTQYTGNNVTLGYQLGVGVDGATVSFPAALRTQPVTLASATRRWAGDYCNTAAMQAQIPASSPDGTYFVCPKS